jgi:hypothetical protein
MLGFLSAAGARAADRTDGPRTGLADPRLGAAVRFARGVAAGRIAGKPSCRQLFDERGADGVGLLDRIEYEVADGGELGGLCARGAVAFTRMGTERTWICSDSFLKLPREQGAVVLLHEALHVAGLGEHPHHPGAPTPVEIDRMVKRSCGL